MSSFKSSAERELSREEIIELFNMLNEELQRDDSRGELYLVGGAVMCLVFDSRPSTRDVDAWFKPTQEIRRAAARVASRADLPERWLNDAVKGFLGAQPDFEPFLDLDSLAVFVARPEYLLAMKCVSMRIGAGFRDEEDVRFLLRALNIESYQEAVDIILSFFSEERVPTKTWFALQELLPQDDG